MATKVIAWNTGSGNITLTYTGQGNGTIAVESDENDLDVSRSQVVSVRTTDNSQTRQITVTQAAQPTEHLYYTIDSIPSASFTEATVNIVNSRTAGGSKSFSNTLSMSINLLDHYQDAHGVEKTRTKSISLSAIISMTGKVTYSSKNDTATLTVTFTQEKVTVDGIQVTLNGTTITQSFAGSSALSYQKTITMSAKVGSSTKSKSTSEKMQVSQTAAGKIGVRFL